MRSCAKRVLCQGDTLVHVVSTFDTGYTYLYVSFTLHRRYGNICRCTYFTSSTNYVDANLLPEALHNLMNKIEQTPVCEIK